MKLVAALALHLVAWFPCVSYADAYRWVDSAGIVHLTQDPTHVPVRERAGALVESIRALGVPSTSASDARESAPHAIPFEMDGQLMRVMVRLDGQVLVPFYLDTGSTEIVLPESVAKRLQGERRSTGHVILETPTGRVHAQTLQLASVQMGSVKVANLRATVAPSLEIGLLGGAFLNQFRYSIDPDTRILTLEPRGARTAAY